MAQYAKMKCNQHIEYLLWVYLSIWLCWTRPDPSSRTLHCWENLDGGNYIAKMQSLLYHWLPILSLFIEEDLHKLMHWSNHSSYNMTLYIHLWALDWSLFVKCCESILPWNLYLFVPICVISRRMEYLAVGSSPESWTRMTGNIRLELCSEQFS